MYSIQCYVCDVVAVHVWNDIHVINDIHYILSYEINNKRYAYHYDTVVLLEFT